MPKKKNKAIVKTSKPVPNTPKNRRINFSGFSMQDSYISLVLGILVVVVLAIVVFIYLNARRSQNIDFNNIRNELQQQLNSEGAKKTNITQKVMGSTYTVKSGDTLWSIAESRYKDGNEWNYIATVNSISDPDMLYSGLNLSLPERALGIKGKTYTVKEGDTLWNIAVSTYGDGFKWVNIATINNLNTPDQIYPGSILVLP